MHPPRSLLGRAALVGAVLLGGAIGADRAQALNYVTSDNGNVWGIHDAAAPGLDTGSIRDVSRVVPGSSANTSNALSGFGGLRLSVPDIPAGDPTARFDGELMRGFGLTFNATDAFTTTTPVTLGGVTVAREVRILEGRNAARFLDSFTNTRAAAVTIDVSFGGTAGTNVDGNRAVVSATGDGDTAIEAQDAWVGLAVPSAADPASSARGPSAVVLGSPAPFTGALSGTGNFQHDPFGGPLETDGLEANFYGFRHRVTLAPGETKSLLRYVVTGYRETNGGTPGAQTTAVNDAAAALAAAPDLSGLSRREKCGLANWDASVVPAVDAAACDSLAPATVPPNPTAELPATSSPYDVVDKSIAQLQADMEAGTTTSQEITRAYLDRIAAFDTGQYGFHSFIHVDADLAMAQARAADERRAAGETGDMLGIPVAVKDLFDTKDQPTTDGTRALAGWQPKSDAFQVARLREAGAVLIGKTNLSEFANSGSYSESGFMMTWNGLHPSKTPLGSSGGSATATALSLAGVSLGSQTGVSLFAPATGASLVTLRGTDGISSGAGVMPLTYLQDFEGPIGRTTTDVAMVLNVTTGTDPDDPATVHADADGRRPADWKAALDPAALEGKRIGYLESSFTGGEPYPYTYGQDDGTGEALKAVFADIEAAGATMVPMSADDLPSTAPNPSFSGRSRTEEGWQAYWDRHPEAPYRTAADILSAEENLPYNQRTVQPAERLTEEDVQQVLTARDQSKANYAAWMDANDVDAVVYPGFRSDVYDNDGAQATSSDRSSGYPTSSFGLPTLVLPVGANPHGYAMSLQFVGRAFDDELVLGMGYALEQQLGGDNRVLSAMAPALEYEPGAAPVDPAPTPAPPPVTTPPVLDPVTEAADELLVTLAASGRLRGRGVRVTVRNRGTTRVRGRVVLRGKLRLRGERRTVRFGAEGVSVGAGRRKTVVVGLNRKGRRAFRGRTRVRLSATWYLRTPSDDSARTKQALVVRRR